MNQRGVPITLDMHTPSLRPPLRHAVRSSDWTRMVGLLAIFVAFICQSSARAQAATEIHQPMRFDGVREGPVNACGKNCREWVSASGKITEETPQQFADFAKGRDLQGSTVVLESRGGHVLAGIWLGREFRRLGMATTIGKTNL